MHDFIMILSRYRWLVMKDGYVAYIRYMYILHNINSVISSSNPSCLIQCVLYLFSNITVAVDVETTV